MKCALRYIILCLTYSLVGFFFVSYYNTASEVYREKYEKIENIKLNCQAIYDGTTEAKKFRTWQLGSDAIQRELEKSDTICDTLHKFFHFQKTPLSAEEKTFPLAFGFLAHIDTLQVLFTLSLLYQPQNQYCITIDNRSSSPFKNILLRIPRCFENIRVQIGDMSLPPLYKMGVLNNVYQCVTDLTTSGSNWKYYQFVASHDVPLKSNLEMVRILKALNGSINTEFYPYSEWRYGIRRSDPPPFTLYQGEMGVALPRAAAEHIVMNRKIDVLLNYLNKTHMPFETFWATVAGNKRELGAPGSLNGQSLLYLQQKLFGENISHVQTTSHVGSTSIARLEAYKTKKWCGENPMCHFGAEDIPMLLKRPELLAHKMFFSLQPAAYICLAKELRRRGRDPEHFNAISYSRMPTVELKSGTPIDRLTHPEWMATSRKYEKWE